MSINYPGVVLAGFHLLIDPPARYAAKIDRERKPNGRIRTFHLRIVAGEQESSAQLSVNLGKKRVDWNRTTGWLLGQQDYGSGSLGVLLLSSPFLLLGSPYIIARRKLYHWSEKGQAMSRHATALLEALEGQLTDDENDLLVEVFRNEYAHAVKMRSQVDLFQAKAVLSAAALDVYVAPLSGGGTHEQWTWRDRDDEVVGEARFERTDDAAPVVRVRGSRFRGGKAAILMECFASREISRFGDNLDPE